MNSQNKSLNFIVFPLMISLFAASGCGLREQRKRQLEEDAKRTERRAERRAEKQAQKAEERAELRAAEAEKKGELKAIEAAARAEERAQKRAEQNRLDSVAKARQDLETRIRYMKALEGTFTGAYFVPGSQTLSIPDTESRLTLRIAVQNLPAPFSDARPLEAHQLDSRMEAITLEVEVLDQSPRHRESTASCSVGGIRPDHVRGLFAVSCPSRGVERKYFVTLDDANLETDTTIDLSATAHRSRLISRNLIDGRIALVRELGVRITNQYGKYFTLQLERVNEPEPKTETGDTTEPDASSDEETGGEVSEDTLL